MTRAQRNATFWGMDTTHTFVPSTYYTDAYMQARAARLALDKRINDIEGWLEVENPEGPELRAKQHTLAELRDRADEAYRAEQAIVQAGEHIRPEAREPKVKDYSPTRASRAVDRSARHDGETVHLARATEDEVGYLAAICTTVADTADGRRHYLGEGMIGQWRVSVGGGK